LIRSGRSANYLLLNPQAWAEHPDYLDFLRQRNPGFNLAVSPFAQPGDSTNSLTLVTLLHGLSATRAICCFHPAPLFEPFAEDFYFEPHGLLYQLKPYWSDAAFAGTNSPELLRDNQTFWRAFEQQPFPDLVRRANPPPPPPQPGMLKRFLNTLRFRPEVDRESQIVAAYYAGALNDWGVELQRAGAFPAAGHCFEEALQLDSSCAPARINQTFNADYQASRAETVARPLETVNRMEEYRDWQHVVRDGAVDDPNFCFMLGSILEANHLYRPAIAQFERVKTLSPARLDTYLGLARLFVQCNDNADGLDSANELLSLSPTNQAGLFLKARASMNLGDFSRALPVLNQLLAQNPTNPAALLARGDTRRNLGLFESARRDYQSVLQTVTNYYPAYAALANIAERETNPPAAIRNYELFLKYAPTNQPAVPAVQARLKALER
jgi:tetratricopeptide (TPR) repeat protein